MQILLTGPAGFIGFHLAKRFLERGDDVTGIDNLNDYYDVSLKKARLSQLGNHTNFKFILMDITDRPAMERLFAENVFDRVIHMAAQAGVRYSLENPHAYVQSNLVGFANVLESCRHQWNGDLSCVVRRASCEKDAIRNTQYARHLIYASSSSVYGSNTKLPFSVSDSVDHPISFYGATKRSNELMAYTYSHLYAIPTTGLRFFTAYGPWGRPDMALFKFTKAILNGEAIDVYNEGRMKRDFTYIGDVVEAVVRITDHVFVRATHDAQRATHYGLYNIGNHSPIGLLDFIYEIEEALGKKAKINFRPMQPGDVAETYADIEGLEHDFDFRPATPIRDGIRQFVEWYRGYYR